MDYQLDLEKLERDEASLLAVRSELRPASMPRKGETRYERIFPGKPSEAELADIGLFHKWAIPKLSDVKRYHIMARVSILPGTIDLVNKYKELLKKAIALPAAQPRRGFFAWLSWFRPLTELEQVEADMKVLRDAAQEKINQAIREFSQPVETLRV